VSKAEQQVSSSLRAALADLPAGASIGNSEPLRPVLEGLESFITECIAEICPQCDSLDGAIPLLARKLKEGEAELLGVCILISDQTYSPLHLRVQISPYADEISWFECRLGEKSLVRPPYGSREADKLMKRLYALDWRVDAFDWEYRVTFGARRL
jgi:hypothetical protein